MHLRRGGVRARSAPPMQNEDVPILRDKQEELSAMHDVRAKKRKKVLKTLKKKKSLEVWNIFSLSFSS